MAFLTCLNEFSQKKMSNLITLMSEENSLKSISMRKNEKFKNEAPHYLDVLLSDSSFPSLNLG